MRKTEAQDESKHARQLIGCTITGTIISPDQEYFGLQLLDRLGKKVLVWVNQDPEGNGPGHLEIEK